MSPIRRVILLTLVLGVLGIVVSIVIIAAGGGFSGAAPSLLSPPSSKDLWTVGEGLQNNTRINYTLSATSPSGLSLINSIVTVHFIQEGNDSWNANFNVMNDSLDYAGSILLSKAYLTNKQMPQGSLTDVYRIIESSLFDIRNFALEPKYLVPGAVWDDVVSGVLTAPIRITGKDSLTVNGTTVESYVLQYDLPSKVSKIWISHGFPLPIKADVGDSDSSSRYTFEIQGYNR
ncbi:MAG: hypothetical protein WBX01_01335 [Nitrososphaeraceae archaeon]|jgi:hypothetical protein